MQKNDDCPKVRGDFRGESDSKAKILNGLLEELFERMMPRGDARVHALETDWKQFKQADPSDALKFLTGLYIKARALFDLFDQWSDTLSMLQSNAMESHSTSSRRVAHEPTESGSSPPSSSGTESEWEVEKPAETTSQGRKRKRPSSRRRPGRHERDDNPRAQKTNQNPASHCKNYAVEDHVVIFTVVMNNIDHVYTGRMTSDEMFAIAGAQLHRKAGGVRSYASSKLGLSSFRPNPNMPYGAKLLAYIKSKPVLAAKLEEMQKNGNYGPFELEQGSGAQGGEKSKTPTAGSTSTSSPAPAPAPTPAPVPAASRTEKDRSDSERLSVLEGKLADVEAALRRANRQLSRHAKVTQDGVARVSTALAQAVHQQPRRTSLAANGTTTTTTTSKRKSTQPPICPRPPTAPKRLAPAGSNAPARSKAPPAPTKTARRINSAFAPPPQARQSQRLLHEGEYKH